MEYARPELLTNPAELEASLQDDNLRELEATVFLKPAEHGYRAESGLDKYNEGHIPGAAFVDLIGAFSDTSSGLGFTLPAVSQLAEAFGDLGVGNEHKVVVYSSGHMMWATRAWWLLHYCGHTNASVLNGGLRRWKDEGRPLSQAPAVYPAAAFTANPQPSVFADKEQVLAAREDPTACTVNALSPEMYQGVGDHHYGRRGHIPGSRNLFYDNLMDGGNFKEAEELQAALNEHGMFDADRVITYCGGGISATIDSFACLLTGKSEVAVYDGSMSEWVKDESLPLTEGAEP